MSHELKSNTQNTQDTGNSYVYVPIGEKIVSQARLNEIEISQFAYSCGDTNPLHHDQEYARQTRFGSIIVCGPHIASLLMAMLARHYSQDTAMVGLESSFQFLKAIKAGELIDLEWEVIATEYKDSLNGEIVDLKGKVTNEQKVEVVTSSGRILVTAQL